MFSGMIWASKLMFSRMWHDYNFCAQGFGNDRCGEPMQGWWHELCPFRGSELCFRHAARQEAKAEVRALTWVLCVCVCVCTRAHGSRSLKQLKQCTMHIFFFNACFLMSGTACYCVLSDSPSLDTLGLGKTRTYIGAHFLPCFIFIYLCETPVLWPLHAKS